MLMSVGLLIDKRTQNCTHNCTVRLVIYLMAMLVGFFCFGILGTADENPDFTLMFSKLLPCLSALELQFSCRTGTGSRSDVYRYAGKYVGLVA